jgi:flavin reductase (DIM6/NTAB) family NADH-FMN oxidoreductase RutF
MNNKHFGNSDILDMESRRRAACMNSITGFKSASLIGTIDKESNANLAIFSSVVHLGSNPALVGFICRPDVSERHTLDNIMSTQNYTINHINQDIFKEAHQTAARYPKNISEFDATGLTTEFLNDFNAPFVKQSHIKYGLEYVERHDLIINGTILIIGKVVEIFLPEMCINEDGSLDLEKAETVAISGLDSYHSTKRLARLSYAKPDKMPTEIS